MYFLSELCKMDSQTYTEELPRKCVTQEDITFFSRPFGINCDVTDPMYRVTTVDGQAERLGKSMIPVLVFQADIKYDVDYA